MTLTCLGWPGLVVVMGLAIFNLYGFLLTFICLGVFTASIFTTIYFFGQEWTEEYWNNASISRLELPSSGIPCIKSKVLSFEKFRNIDKRLTGSSVIDEPLKEVLQLALRDFVLVWYRKLSEDEKFPQSLLESAQQVIKSIADRAKDVDWMQFLTVQVVDDFASHFRLFREAEHKFGAIKAIDGKTTQNVVSTFFELENEKHSNMPWSDICTSTDKEKAYLRDLSEVLLYLLLPVEDFNNKPFRYLFRDIIVNKIFCPTVGLLSDTDYINQNVVRLCKDVSLTSEGFIAVLRLTNSADELLAVLENINSEIAIQRSKDSGGDDDAMIKQQLSSLMFIKSIVDQRLKLLQGVVVDSRVDLKKCMSADFKLCSSPLDVILKNTTTLSYFIDFMMCTRHQEYILFYLTVEGYRASIEQQISQMQLDQLSLHPSIEVSKLETFREEALNIFEKYLSVQATPSIELDEMLLKRVYQRIQTEQPSETWFDELQSKVLEILSKEKFFGSFKKSPQYIKMLAELDLLKDASKSEEDDTQSLNQLQSANSEISESISSSSQEDLPLDSAYANMSTLNKKQHKPSSADVSLRAKIVGTGFTRDAKPRVVYVIEVNKSTDSSKENKWQVHRCDSDFYDFHTIVDGKCSGLVGHNFPGKTTYDNMNPEFITKRQQRLNGYLQFLLNVETWNKFPDLQELVLNFLEPIPFCRSEGRISEKNEDDIPLRMLLELVEEVFELKSNNQWLRRGIVVLSREFIKTMYGDKINRKILDHVVRLTSSEKIAEYVKTLRNAIRSHGFSTQNQPHRDKNTRLRTRVAAKMAILCFLPDELKRLLGSKTTNEGIHLLFEIFQHPELNRRLLYKLFENTLTLIFPDNDIGTVLRKLHSTNPN